MYDYKMFYVWVEIWFICLKILVSFTVRFQSTKLLISTFPSTNCIAFMSFSNAKIIYTIITSFNVNKMSLDRALCSKRLKVTASEMIHRCLIQTKFLHKIYQQNAKKNILTLASKQYWKFITGIYNMH